MKKHVFLVFTFFFSFAYVLRSFAQVPALFNYQGIARDAKGNPLSMRDISLRIAILGAPDQRPALYEEVQQVTTNEFGLYTIQIGAAQDRKGRLSDVPWEQGNKFVRVDIDPYGGTNFSLAGLSQLLSVPFALYADRAGMARNGSERTGQVSSSASHASGDANYLSKFTALNVIGKSQIFDNGTSLGIGTNTPVSTSSIHIKRSSNGQYLYLENPDTIGFGSFRMFNDLPTGFATFTKYGSKSLGGYTGIADKYPFANILGFGNNGPMLNASTGNLGFAITKAATNKLKIHIDAANLRLGLGGNANPQTQVHISNTESGSDTLKFTNQTTGHGINDGTELRLNGNVTRLVNRENGALVFGTNSTDRLAIGASGNVGIGTNSPATTLDVNGQIRVQGGNPGIGKVLTSDATGLATWTNGVPGPQGPPGPAGAGGFVHHIGEIFGGGIIIHLYKDSLGSEHGLIMTLTDIDSTLEWVNMPLQINTIPGAYSTWDGLSNSIAITNAPGHLYSAAKICLDLVQNGYSDWYLPSVLELATLCPNVFTLNQVLAAYPGATEIKPLVYWSSTEVSAQSVQVFYNFYWGLTMNASSKTANTFRLRAIRRF